MMKKLTLRIVGRSHGPIWFWTEIEKNLSSFGIQAVVFAVFHFGDDFEIESGVRAQFTLISKSLYLVLRNLENIWNQSFQSKIPSTFLVVYKILIISALVKTEMLVIFERLRVSNIKLSVDNSIQNRTKSKQSGKTKNLINKRQNNCENWIY